MGLADIEKGVASLGEKARCKVTSYRVTNQALDASAEFAAATTSVEGVTTAPLRETVSPEI